jgi:hypothetical protein
MPWQIGRTLMALLEANGLSAPCFTADDRTAITLLVRSATGSELSRLIGGEIGVQTGDAQEIALPPSMGLRWDTLPWHPATYEQVDLPDGEGLLPYVRQALRVHANTDDQQAAAPQISSLAGGTGDRPRRARVARRGVSSQSAHHRGDT